MGLLVGLVVAAGLIAVFVLAARASAASARERERQAAIEAQRASVAEAEARAAREAKAREEAALAEAARQEAARKAAAAKAKRLAEYETWPLDRLKFEVEDVRDRIRSKEREHQALSRDHDDFMDELSRKQSQMDREIGTYAYECSDYPDVPAESEYWCSRWLQPVEKELRVLNRRMSEMRVVLDKKWA